MKKISKFSKKSLYLALLIGATLTMASCKKKGEVNPDTTAKVEALDKTFFTQLKKSGDEYAKGAIWKGYNFGKIAMFFVHRDAQGKPTKGYLVNPPEKVSGAVKVGDADNQGLKIYRYDKGITAANDQLKKGNDAFDIRYELGKGKYYLQGYTDASVSDYEAISLATHEVFHFYFQNTWQNKAEVLQEEQNYPITKDLLSYQLLLLKIAEKMPAETDKTKLKGYLEMFVALRTEEMKADTSAKKLVKFMANNQEEGEGSARYIEYEVNYKIFPDFASKRPSFIDVKTASINNKEEVRSTFAFDMWYGTGAAVIYMLDRLGVDIEPQIQSTKNTFEVAESYLKLTNAQKTAALNKAKTEFGWAAIQTEAARLAGL